MATLHVHFRYVQVTQLSVKGRWGRWKIPPQLGLPHNSYSTYSTGISNLNPIAYRRGPRNTAIQLPLLAPAVTIMSKSRSRTCAMLKNPHVTCFVVLGGFPFRCSVRSIRTQQLGQAEVTENANNACSPMQWNKLDPISSRIWLNKTLHGWSLSRLKASHVIEFFDRDHLEPWDSRVVLVCHASHAVDQQSGAPTGSNENREYSEYGYPSRSLPPSVHHWTIRLFHKFNWKWSKNEKKHQETNTLTWRSHWIVIVIKKSQNIKKNVQLWHWKFTPLASWSDHSHVFFNLRKRQKHTRPVRHCGGKPQISYLGTWWHVDPHIPTEKAVVSKSVPTF